MTDTDNAKLVGAIERLTNQLSAPPKSRDELDAEVVVDALRDAGIADLRGDKQPASEQTDGEKLLAEIQAAAASTSSPTIEGGPHGEAQD